MTIAAMCDVLRLEEGGSPRVATMVTAMNPHERISMLAGIRAGAPAEIYEGTLMLAGSVLEPAEMRALEAALLATNS
ncbi:unannotated protein [freshwater metagenome]|uniref:Unannotated protein n=1 Tax=freshwater metagenome TaxID=449393 RepID=A0A6J7H0A1_9ZZZZ|nr:hypothetical protein [Actinomycetota bacterium]